MSYVTLRALVASPAATTLAAGPAVAARQYQAQTGGGPPVERHGMLPAVLTVCRHDSPAERACLHAAPRAPAYIHGQVAVGGPGSAAERHCV